jgi:transposase
MIVSETIRYIGLDVHKRVVEACILDSRGKEVLRRRFDLTKETLEHFAEEDLLPTDHVALEATTNSWSVVRVLKPLIPSVFVSNPVQTKAIASAKLKTDKVDAEMLAQLLRCEFLPLVWQPDEETQILRSITSRRVSLIQQRTAVKNRLHSTLHQRLVQVPPGISDLYGKKGLAWLRRTLPELPPMDRLAIESDLRLLEAMGAEVKVVEDELFRRGFEDERLKLLVTLPGVDVVVAQTMLAALGDITRFKSADKAASYFGLVPRTRQSADKVSHGRITKAGSSHSRWLMVQAAWASCRTMGPLAGFYRKLANKKCHNVAVVAVARKLVTYAWHMLKNNEPYRYASPASASIKLGRIRTRGGGEKRAGKPGHPVQPFTEDGERIIPPLDRVYEAEGLPTPRGFDGLPDGEKKMLRKKRLVRQTRALEKTQRKPVRQRKPLQNQAAKGRGAVAAKAC